MDNTTGNNAARKRLIGSAVRDHVHLEGCEGTILLCPYLRFHLKTVPFRRRCKGLLSRENQFHRPLEGQSRHAENTSNRYIKLAAKSAARYSLNHTDVRGINPDCGSNRILVLMDVLAAGHYNKLAVLMDKGNT
ncbi:MAG: hypothetical protein A4E62_02986 [Syntrophorhabdus sp. PtaU1.Bin002]|nr:MAG: hypothetical protein A4E62_02986 [Syntrophorhabdus sp. PtaU1.Bin002]